MIDRALKKRRDLQNYLDSLDAGSDSSGRLPAADILTSEDWKVLLEIRTILEPLYKLTMKTQGWGVTNGHGRLWSVLASMEYLLEHLETWKMRYQEQPATEATQDPGTSLPGSPLPRRRGDRPAHSIRPSSRLGGAEVPSRYQGSRFRSRFNEAALPSHVSAAYLATTQGQSSINRLEAKEKANIRASINNAWVKLNNYYTLLEDSPLRSRCHPEPEPRSRVARTQLARAPRANVAGDSEERPQGLP